MKQNFCNRVSAHEHVFDQPLRKRNPPLAKKPVVVTDADTGEVLSRHKTPRLAIKFYATDDHSVYGQLTGHTKTCYKNNVNKKLQFRYEENPTL